MFGWTMDPENPNFEVKVIEKCSETELKVVEPRLVASTWNLEAFWEIRVPVASHRKIAYHPLINKHDS